MNLPLWKKEAEEMLNDCFMHLSALPARPLDFERVLHMADRQIQLINWIEMSDQKVIAKIERASKPKREV